MSSKSLLLCGNEALVHGALLAGCDAYFGYPITPAGEIIECAAKKFPELGRVFIQAESEIGAICMVMGAAAAGQRAMTASSGLGISLMQEAVSYLAGMEIPCVIADVMRCGPGIGNISVEQSDYFQVVKGGGHGGYRCPVIAPASAQEMCAAAFTAFELAEKYRTPVYILTDGMIGQMMESVALPEPLEKSAPAPYALAPTDDADIVLVAYGIMSRLAKNAIAELRRSGVKAGLVRPKRLFPFPKDALNALVPQTKKFFAVELSGGQMIEDVKLAIECRRPVELIHRVGGKLISVEELVAKVKAAAGTHL